MFSYIHSWTSEDVECPSYAALLGTIRCLPPDYQGVLAGVGPEAKALVFLVNRRIRGVRFDPGGYSGRGALVEITRRCDTMTWSLYRAPEGFAGIVPVLASIVGESDRQLIGIVQPATSSYTDALNALEHDSGAYLVAGSDNARTDNWVYLSVGGRTTRIVVGASGEIAGDTDPNALLAAFRRQKEPSLLYRAAARDLPEAIVDAPGDLSSLPLMSARPQESTARLPRAVLPAAIALVAVVAIVAMLAWWRAASKSGIENAPPPRTMTAGTTPAPVSGGTRQAGGDERAAALREEIDGLRRQIASRSRATSGRVMTIMPLPERESPLLLPDDIDEVEDDRARVDSLLGVIARLETAVSRARPEMVDPPPPVAELPVPTAIEAPRRDDTAHAAPSAQEMPARVYAESLVDRPPSVIASSRVRYPERARQLGIRGNVLLSVLVAANGDVERVIPLRGHELLRRAATDGVRGWEFSPATVNGRPVSCWKTVIVAFGG